MEVELYTKLFSLLFTWIFPYWEFCALCPQWPQSVIGPLRLCFTAPTQILNRFTACISYRIKLVAALSLKHEHQDSGRLWGVWGVVSGAILLQFREVHPPQTLWQRLPGRPTDVFNKALPLPGNTQEISHLRDVSGSYQPGKTWQPAIPNTHLPPCLKFCP